MGNPPGKDGSVGDAVNWECLLDGIANGADLHLVSEDRDFRSPLKDDSLHEFLDAEWKHKKKSKIHYYNKISSFFKSNFPDIEVEDEIEKDKLITDLTYSKSYRETHLII